MNSDLCIFTNDMFGDIGVIMVDDRPYFEGVGVARILGYKNPRDAISRHCKHPGVVFHDTGIITGKRRDGTDAIQYVKRAFIDEGNLYRLIIKSKKDEALAFERWVMDEVLVSIRKNGGYVNSNKFIENLISICTTQHNDIKKLMDDRDANRAFIHIGKSIAGSGDFISIGAFAKILNSMGISIGRNRLFDWFRANGYIMKQGKENQPKQVYIDKGLFVTRQYSVNTSDGVRINVTPFVTGRGQAYFIDKIREDFGYERFYKNV